MLGMSATSKFRKFYVPLCRQQTSNLKCSELPVCLLFCLDVKLGLSHDWNVEVVGDRRSIEDVWLWYRASNRRLEETEY